MKNVNIIELKIVTSKFVNVIYIEIKKGGSKQSHQRELNTILDHHSLPGYTFF